MSGTKLLGICTAGCGLWAIVLGFPALGLMAALIGATWAWADEQPRR